MLYTMWAKQELYLKKMWELQSDTSEVNWDVAVQSKICNDALQKHTSVLHFSVFLTRQSDFLFVLLGKKFFRKEHG